MAEGMSCAEGLRRGWCRLQHARSGRRDNGGWARTSTRQPQNDYMSVMIRKAVPIKVRRRLQRAVARVRREADQPATEPVYPDVGDERTNVGPLMDTLVTRAKRNQQPLGVDPDYDLVRQNFDYLNYMLEAQPFHEQADIDPIEAFLRSGASAVYSPNYNFSMRNYLARYPARKDGPEQSPYLEWIKRGRSAGEIADPAQGIEKMAKVLGLEPAQIVDELVATRTDMMERLRTGRLGEMFAKAAEIEPLIGSVWAETPRTRMLPLQGQFVAGQVAAIHACHEMAGFRRARLVVATNRVTRGVGRRLEHHLGHALSGTISPDDIVVIYTEKGGASPRGRFPAGIREIDFAAAAEGLPDEHRQQALMSLLRSFHSDAILNIDSPLLYRVLTTYGKALARSERIFVFLPCIEQRAQGNWDGWSLKWFYAGFDLVAGFITDSEFLRNQLTEMYQLSDADRERIHVIRAPVDQEIAAATRPQAKPLRRPVVYWAGRWDRQKRVDIALKVARRMPDVDFRFWREGPLRDSEAAHVPENARVDELDGPISALDLSQADAWLYTSAWDGVPDLLLEVAMTEVPIVGSLVGGVGEVLSDEESWPIADWEDPEAYEKAIREILSDPADARRRSNALRERLARERTRHAVGEYAARLLLDRTDSLEAAT